ncbi:MAG: fatty acid desaturase [Phycisphaerae bacterium]
MPAHLDLARFTTKRGDARSLAIVAAHVAFVVAPIFLAAAAGIGWHLPACWLWFGLAMNGLLNLMHEASHYHVFTSRAASDRLGRWLLGPLALADFDSYRARHWDHHRRLGQPDDPKTTYHLDIHGPRLPAFLLRCLLGVEALRRGRVQTTGDADHDPPLLSRVWVWRVLAGQALLASVLAALAVAVHGPTRTALFAAAAAYFGVYLYGLASLTVFAAGLRAIAEHQPGPDAAPCVGAAALRNFRCNPLSRLILGAYGFAEHATHHDEPAIPYYHLPAATRSLAQRDPSRTPRFSYLATLGSLIARPAAPAAPPRPR